MGMFDILKGEKTYEYIDGLFFQFKIDTGADVQTMQVMADRMRTFFHEGNEISKFFKEGTTRFFVNEQKVLDVEVSLTGMGLLQRDSYAQIKDAYVDWLHYSVGVMGMEITHVNSYVITDKNGDRQTYLFKDTVQNDMGHA